MTAQYTNPVYPSPFPDPFVLKYRGVYWAYCTGFWRDGRCFGILHSRDLVHWSEASGALAPLPGEHTCYWAPEVSYYNGQFYLYYSVGNEKQMEIRVAVSDAPQGPYEDSGHRLTKEAFAIDAHVFQDTDGARYLFYATDFLEHERIGTGTVVDRLVDPFHLAGKPVPVTRAKYDWQIYDPRRLDRGGVRWHTVEGSFVLKYKGRYYQMYSGGSWRDPGYSVDYATSAKILASEEWEQTADGQQRLPVLRSFPERGVIGPGHNSVVRGPDNRQLFCVYHRWQQGDPDSACKDENTNAGRVMAIDRLEFTGDRLVVLGPSSDPQPIPLDATLRPLLQMNPDLPATPGWRWMGGKWTLQDGRLTQEEPYPGKLAEALFELPGGSFLLEMGLHSAMEQQRSPGAFGILLEGAGQDGDPQELLSLDLLPTTLEGGRVTAIISTGSGETRREISADLPAGFQVAALHLLRMEVNGRAAGLALDGQHLWQGKLSAAPERLGLFTRGMAAAFSDMELTLGWEDRFDHPRASLEDLGWRVESGMWRLEAHTLRQADISGPARITRPIAPLNSFELVLNMRLEEQQEAGGCGLALTGGEGSTQELTLLLQQVGSGWALSVPELALELSLPPEFDPREAQQFRFRRLPGRIQASWVGPWKVYDLGEVEWSPDPETISLVTRQAAAVYDLVRVTAIPDLRISQG